MKPLSQQEIKAASDAIQMYPELLKCDVKDFAKRPLAYIPYLHCFGFEITRLVRPIVEHIRQSKPGRKRLSGNSYYRSDYTRKPIWKKTIRPRILKRDGYKCRICGKEEKLNVHHRSYENEVLAGNDDSMLITLCEEHHLEIEFREYFAYGDKRNIPLTRVESEIRLKRLLREKKEKDKRHKNFVKNSHTPS